MKSRFFFIWLCLFLSAATAFGGEIIVRGFYYGRNLYVRNPYLPEKKAFCVKQVFLNGRQVMGEINVSAFELDLSSLKLNDRVVVRFVFNDDCQPEITNLHVIKNENQFGFNNIEVLSNSLSWSTQSENKEGFYTLERARFGQWILLDTIKGKGSFDLNQYSVSVKQYPGVNEFKLHYFPDKNEIIPISSDLIIYESDEEPVLLYMDMDNGRVSFSKVAEYVLLNNEGRTVLKGEGVHLNMQRLPRGLYVLYIENRVEEIIKPR